MGDPLLSVEGLTRVFPSSGGLFRPQRNIMTALDDVDFTLFKGETLGLIGGSGSGKSTLARLLVGLDRPTRGRIVFDGAAIDACSDAAMRPIRRRLQLVAQDAASALNPRKPVGRQIAAPLLRFGLAATRAEATDAAAALLEQVGLRADDARRLPHQFSGGQRQRINIARALGVRADLLILDEPTSALDVTVQAQILTLLAELKQAHGLSYLFISHNLAVVSSFCDRVLVLDQGRLVDDFPAFGFADMRRATATKHLLGAIQNPIYSI